MFLNKNALDAAFFGARVVLPRIKWSTSLQEKRTHLGIDGSYFFVALRTSSTQIHPNSITDQTRLGWCLESVNGTTAPPAMVQERAVGQLNAMKCLRQRTWKKCRTEMI